MKAFLIFACAIASILAAAPDICERLRDSILPAEAMFNQSTFSLVNFRRFEQAKILLSLVCMTHEESVEFKNIKRYKSDARTENVDCFREELKKFNPRARLAFYLESLNHQEDCSEAEGYAEKSGADYKEYYTSMYHGLKLNACTLEEFLNLNSIAVYNLNQVIVANSNLTPDELDEELRELFYKPKSVMESQITCIVSTIINEKH